MRKISSRSQRLVALAVLPAACAALVWRSGPAAGQGVRVSPMLYGLMTEEINFSYDGGLYGELIRNRVFKDDANGPAHWSVVQEGGGTGAIALDSGQPLNDALGTSLKLTITGA